MRQPKYLSFSAIKLFYKDRKEYYLKYLLDERPPRLPQTKPMSVGSAFDAEIKSYLAGIIYGETKKPAELEYDGLFEKQVESQNRDFAREAGKECLRAYRVSGAAADLLTELSLASAVPRFEFKVEGRLKHQDVIGGIPVLGFPDLYYTLNSGIHVIDDFKVNGFCGKRDTSPAAGYIKSRDSWKGKPSRSHGKSHKDAHLMIIEGITINTIGSLGQDWAEQLMLYGWLEGVEVGDQLIGGIEQLSGVDGKQRISSHRVMIDPAIQFNFLNRIAYMWKLIQSGHIFDDISKDENDTKCKELDNTYNNLDFSDPMSRFVNKHSRSQ